MYKKIKRAIKFVVCVKKKMKYEINCGGCNLMMIFNLFLSRTLSSAIILNNILKVLTVYTIYSTFENDLATC